MKRTIFTSLNKLQAPDRNHRVVLNVWKPGYYIADKESKTREFVSTSTFEAALVYLKNHYGAEEYLKYKENAHPGHAAVETPNHYLSVSMDDEIRNLRLATSHPIVHSKTLRQDVIGMKRFPEDRVDLYTLNCQATELSIMKLIETVELYSLLGNRFGLSEGESCATASHMCLRFGGIDSLLAPYSQLVSRTSILTPAILLDYVKAAQLKEHRLHKESIEYSREFAEESSKLKSKLSKILNELYKITSIEEEQEAEARLTRFKT